MPAVVSKPVERTEMGEDPSRLVTAGRIVGVYGVQGWVKVASYTDPPELLLDFSPWRVRWDGQWHNLALAAGRRPGAGLVVSLESYDDRDQARRLVGAEVGLLREQLPPLGPGEYYWADLIGLRVYS